MATRKTFTSRNRAFAALIRSNDNIVVTDTIDSSGAVENLVDSAYVLARAGDAGVDSAGITALIDSAYINARADAGTDSAGVTGIIDSDYAFSLIKIRSTNEYHIQPTQPVINDLGEYWYKSDSDKLYKSVASTTLTTTMPPYAVTSTVHYNKIYDWAGNNPSSATRTNISGTDALGGSFTSGATASAWFFFTPSLTPAALNASADYQFTTAQDIRGIIIERSDPNAGRLERIDYVNGDYADNGFPGGGTVTWYNSGGTPLGKTANANTTGNTFVDISHPTGVKATKIGFSQVGDYYSGNDVFLFFAGAPVWEEVGETDLIPIEDSAYDLGSPTKKWKDLYLSGNTISLGGSRLSSTAGGGLSVTDSAGAPAAISGSNIFDSAKVEGIVDSAYINARVGSGTVEAIVDSAYIQLRDRFQDSSGIISIVDSAYVQARQTSGGGGVDSAATITLINSVIDSVGPSRSFTYTFTATASQTTFSGADNNNNTLAYSAGNIMTFLNGILLVDSDDYVATTGNSIVLNSAANLNDILNVVKFRATGSGGNLSHQQFKYTVASPTTTFSGNDDNGNTLSYETGELQVFLNGILLIDSQDYTASTGTSVVLTAATDSNDVLAISKYIGGGSGGGTVDSADIIAIVDSAYVAARGGGGSGDAFRATHFVYTTATPTTTITGADDNSATLSYIENQIQVYRNGILLIDSADYTATNGTSITLGTTTDSNDTVVITAFRGVISGGLDSAAVISLADATRIKNYVYTTASPTITITGTDDNSATLSYLADKIQVYQNGILLIDSADYTATNGTSITLGVATDSGDTIVVSTFRGSRGTLDSATVTSIIDSAYVAARSAGGGTDSATVISLSGELKGGMFRINPQSLSINTTIDSAENAHVAGPISFDSGVVLTINGNLVIS